AVEHLARLREPVRVQHRHAALEWRLHLGVAGRREGDLAELVLGEPGDRERREDEEKRDRSQRRLHTASLLPCCRFRATILAYAPKKGLLSMNRSGSSMTQHRNGRGHVSNAFEIGRAHV